MLTTKRTRSQKNLLNQEFNFGHLLQYEIIKFHSPNTILPQSPNYRKGTRYDFG